VFPGTAETEYHIVVPGFDSIIGQKNPIRQLKTFLSNGTLPHALLFTGIDGIGKRSTATQLALALNCSAAHADTDSRQNALTSCGVCPACRQILSGNHPDVQTVTPEGNLLRIDRIRLLIQTLTMKPFSARHRVVVIDQAQTMNKEAANALLKLLEEPPPHTTLILTALSRSELLPTITSRCRHIAFAPLSHDDLKILLKDSLAMDEAQAEPLAAMADGSFTKARMLANDTWQHQRNWIIRAAGLDTPGALRTRPLTLALAFSAQLALNKEKVQEHLDMLKTWIRDLSIFRHQPSRIINRDRKDLIDAVRSDMDESQLLDMWESIEKAQKAIAARANLRLTLDIMVLRMAGLTDVQPGKN
jgi:DNA polymerase-3 subunit delta'